MPDITPQTLALIVVSVIAIGLIALYGKRFAAWVAANVAKWVVGIAVAVIDAVGESLLEVARQTPSHYDDLLVRSMLTEYARLLTELRTVRGDLADIKSKLDGEETREFPTIEGS